MRLLLMVLSVWGLADSVGLGLAPAVWARFWGRWLNRLGHGGAPPRLMAVLEAVVCLPILRRIWR